MCFTVSSVFFFIFHFLEGIIWFFLHLCFRGRLRNCRSWVFGLNRRFYSLFFPICSPMFVCGERRIQRFDLVSVWTEALCRSKLYWLSFLDFWICSLTLLSGELQIFGIQMRVSVICIELVFWVVIRECSDFHFNWNYSIYWAREAFNE